jgi:cytochrome bd-type quinol oxidase subunit 2
MAMALDGETPAFNTEATDLPVVVSPTQRAVRDAWILSHPRVPKTRPGLLYAIFLGLIQAPQSWKMHQASTESEHVQNKKIIVSEATNGALVGALFMTVTTANIFDGDGVPGNGMETRPSIVNLYYSLNCTSTFCFSMSIIYSLALLLIMESLNDKDASDISHALGMGIHWPITNFILGILLLVVALFVKGYFDVDLWVWIIGIIILSVQLSIYFIFLGTGSS